MTTDRGHHPIAAERASRIRRSAAPVGAGQIILSPPAVAALASWIPRLPLVTTAVGRQSAAAIA